MSTISPPAAAAQEAALLQLIMDSQTTNYLTAAALTLVILEHISTFKEEIEYVWKSRLSLWSVLYVWTRYATLIALATDASCGFIRHARTSRDDDSSFPVMFRPMSNSKMWVCLHLG
ncbi:hypothetical protein FB45DRAFT_1017286 [Roridomyces roridus]|uniref:DUF6533 domain-containing protein n=1 Tax=Roridomyces roridus TaxID=1738132 RepID=A0AAD7CIA1_9AGAR|nr:hypothetical protein FB45DRAFT_1017286 [Roridomyces roridus]